MPNVYYYRSISLDPIDGVTASEHDAYFTTANAACEHALEYMRECGHEDVFVPGCVGFTLMQICALRRISPDIALQLIHT